MSIKQKTVILLRNDHFCKFRKSAGLINLSLLYICISFGKIMVKKIHRMRHFVLKANLEYFTAVLQDHPDAQTVWEDLLKPS